MQGNAPSSDRPQGQKAPESDHDRRTTPRCVISAARRSSNPLLLLILLLLLLLVLRTCVSRSVSGSGVRLTPSGLDCGQGDRGSAGELPDMMSASEGVMEKQTTSKRGSTNFIV